MADTGSEKKDYIFYNQDRYLVYAAMGGMRCLVFTYDDDHMNHYCKRIALVKKHLELVKSYTGPLLDFELPRPLFMPCNKASWPYQLQVNNNFLKQVQDPAVINPHVIGGIYLNQLSPAIFGLLKQFYFFLHDNHQALGIRLDEYERMANCALKWHNKANYVNLMRHFTMDTAFPAHIPTAIFSSRLLKTLTWHGLKHCFSRQTGKDNIKEFYIKSNMDAAGEVSVVLNKTNFSSRLGILKKEIELKVTRMERADSSVLLLVQPYIQSFVSDEFPHSIGITYNILNKDRFKALAVIGQVYEDATYQTFIGSYMSDHLTDHVFNSIGRQKIKKLLGLFAGRGYRGPINLDAVRNHKNEYHFIYDCNPRLGGTFPGLILKKAFEKQGLCINRLMTLGYRGRIIYPDLKAKLEQLKALGLLFTRQSQKGLYLIPSIVRPQSFDIALINMEIKDMRDIIDSDVIDSLSDRQKKDLKGVYL